MTWSGLIQFGMVALPCRLFGATEEHSVRLHEIHTADGSRVEHRRFCRAEGREIPPEELGRGFAMPDGRMVPITAEDLAHLPLPTKRTIEVLGFVPAEAHGFVDSWKHRGWNLRGHRLLTANSRAGSAS